jgi:hypothetical protein
MGAGNVALLTTRWSRYLNDVPFRVATQMCVTSLDEGQPPQYFAGWALLATAAGATFPPECGLSARAGGECRGCARCQAARATVKRALRALSEAGLIRLTQAAGPGKHATYAVLVHANPAATAVPIQRPGKPTGRRFTPREDQERETPSVSQTRDTQRLAMHDTQRLAMHDTQRLAKEEGGGLEEHTEEEHSPKSLRHQALGRRRDEPLRLDRWTDPALTDRYAAEDEERVASLARRDLARGELP